MKLCCGSGRKTRIGRFSGAKRTGSRTPIDPSRPTRWRKRRGEAGGEELRAETIEAAKQAPGDQARRPEACDRGRDGDGEGERISDAHPADARLLERCREHLVRASARHGLTLWQNYHRDAPRLTIRSGSATTCTPSSPRGCIVRCVRCARGAGEAGCGAATRQGGRTPPNTAAPGWRG